jgi:hypothetical protein
MEILKTRPVVDHNANIVPQTSPSDTQIRHDMHAMRCMHVGFS